MEINIESNGMNGEGIARIGGKVYFINGGVAGDVAEVKIVKENKNFGIMEIDQIKHPSENRCSPACEHYGKCGGCNMQHIKYAETLKIKKNNIQGLLTKSGIEAKVTNVKKSPLEYWYRNKLTMYVTNSQSLGFYKQNSKQLIEINSCKLVSEKFNNLINLINIFLKQNIEFNPFILKGMAIREINDIFMINLILSKKIILNKFENFLKLNKIKYSLYYCINNNSNSNIQTYPCYFAGGEKDVFVLEYDITYPVLPLSFLQVNAEVKKIIYNKINEVVPDDSVVLDAYSGAGLLSAIISKKAKKVFAVEIDKMASLACKELCKMNQIKNIESECNDCAEAVPKILINNSVDVILLDPARRGVDEKTLNAVINAGVNLIIYLSCNPATLARDIKKILDSNFYNVLSVEAFDMFPQTSEVETLMILKKKEN